MLITKKHLLKVVFVKKTSTQAYAVKDQFQTKFQNGNSLFRDPNDIYINKKTKIFTFFRISSSFLSKIHYVVISITYRSIFIIAPKK